MALRIVYELLFPEYTFPCNLISVIEIRWTIHLPGLLKQKCNFVSKEALCLSLVSVIRKKYLS